MGSSERSRSPRPRERRERRSHSPRERRRRSRSRSRSGSRDRARRRDKRTKRHDKKRRSRQESSSSSSFSSSSSDVDTPRHRRRKKKVSKRKERGKHDNDVKLLQAIRQTASGPSSSKTKLHAGTQRRHSLILPAAAAAGASSVSLLNFMKPLSTGYDGDRANNSNQFYRGWAEHNALAKDEPRKKELTRLEVLAKEQDSD